MFKSWIPVIIGTLIASAFANDEVLIHKKGIYKGSQVGSNRAELGNAMRAVVNSLSTPMPPNFGQFVSSAYSDVALDIRDTDMNGVDPVLAAWGLPAEVNNFLANIKFSESVHYQTYKFVLKHNDVALGEFVASGRNDGGQISLAFIKVNVHANPIQQFNVVKVCKRIVGIKRCHDERHPRGFTGGELQVIQDGMMHHGYLKLMEKANTINMAVFENMIAVASKNKTDKEQLVDAIRGSIKILKNKFERRNHSEIVKNVSAPGFASFEQNAVIQSIDGLDGRFFDKWADSIVRRLAVDNQTKAELQKYLDRIPEAEAGKWNMFRTIYSSTNSSSASYLCLMSYKTEAGKYKIYNIQLSNSFELAQEILIVRNSQSDDEGFFFEEQESIERVPKQVTEDDLKSVLDFFDLIAMEKFMKQFGEPLQNFIALE